MSLLEETEDEGYGPLWPNRNGTVTFVLFRKAILPLDGFVFWVRADLLSASAALNSSPLNTFGPNQPISVVQPAHTLNIKGSLHVTSVQKQQEDADFAVNAVTFTTRDQVQDFNTCRATEMYIARWDDILFAFSQRTMFNREAGLNHYTGDAVYPTMYPQIVVTPGALDTRLVVSNSLPAWLRFNSLPPPPPWNPLLRSITPMMPSYGVQDNYRPPYCAVHIPPERTRVLGGAIPMLGRRSYGTSQLCADTVKLTTWGLRNDEAMDLRDSVLASIEWSGGDPMGLMSVGAMRDEKSTQAELSILAQKKTIEFEVSYYQHRMRDLSRQLIKEAVVTWYYAD